MAECGDLPRRGLCEPGRCQITADEYLDRIATALPRGVLWMLDDERNYSAFWRAIAELLAWFQNTVCSAIDEFFPCYSENLLNRHADIWGYPVECMGYPETAEQLCKWITLVGSPCFGNNLWTLKALIEFAGLDYVESVEEVIPQPIRVGCSRVGCERFAPIAGDNGGCSVSCCHIKITISDSFFAECRPFRVGNCCSRVCEKLGTYDLDALRCIIGRYFAGTTPVYIANTAGARSILIEPDKTCFS